MRTSPCVGTCRIDEASGLCIGCVRTRKEIAGWRHAAPDDLARIWADLPARRARLGIELHRLGWATDDIGSFVTETLRPESGTWVLGLSGAIAEFCISPDEPVAVDRDGVVVTARTARGALRLALSDQVRALSLTLVGASGRGMVVLAVPRGRPDPATLVGLADLGLDHDTIAPGRDVQRLFDLGIMPSPVRFCVRTSDPDLIAELDTRIGQRWPDLLAGVGGRVLQVSPTRVVTTPIGRAEVYTPIPPPGGQSPDGPHTHLLPAHLTTGRETPPGIDLPEVLVPCAIFYPRAAASDEKSCS